MARKNKQQTPKEDDMTVNELAELVSSAFIKQNDLIIEQNEQTRKEVREEMEQRFTQQKHEILEEIDNRGYITKKDLEKTLDDRGYATNHDLQDAVLDAKDEIIAHIDQAVMPRITRLEQKA